MEDFLAQLRRVNGERYAAWAVTPLMLCEHCGRSANEAEAAGSTHCNAPFAAQRHNFTREHPHLKTSMGEDSLYLSNEFGGEAGEVLNVVKKLDRERRGWVGSRATVSQLADEIADCVICLDNLARGYGIDLVASVARKFNETSDKNGFPHRLTA